MTGAPPPFLLPSDKVTQSLMIVYINKNKLLLKCVKTLYNLVYLEVKAWRYWPTAIIEPDTMSGLAIVNEAV